MATLEQIEQRGCRLEQNKFLYYLISPEGKRIFTGTERQEAIDHAVRYEREYRKRAK